MDEQGKKTVIQRLPIVIFWYDHAASEERGWRTIDEVKKDKALLMASVGWIVHENDDIVVLAGSWSDEDLVASTQTILKKLIKEPRIEFLRKEDNP